MRLSSFLSTDTSSSTYPYSFSKAGKVAVCSLMVANILAGTAVAAPENNDEYIQWLASYTGEGAALVDGGKETGNAYAGQLFLGAEIDMQKAAGWNSTKIHVAFNNRHGKSVAEKYIGNSTSVQEIYGGQNSRLTRLSVETHLMDGQLELEGGRMPANISFLGSELCQYFQNNAACGNPTFVFRTSNFSWWPVSAWGARAKYWLNNDVYFHAGVYEENSSHQDNGDHGFDWSTDESTGVVLPFTLGYQTTWENDRYPSKYEVGGWYDSTDYTDPLLDADGVPALVSGNENAAKDGRSGVFLRFEQVVTRPEMNSQRGLTVFGDFVTGVSGELTEDYLIKLGLLQRGTFTGRNDDAIGFVVTRQQYSDEALQNVQLARALNGGIGIPPSSQTMLELSYSYQYDNNVRIIPNVHYIINPDQFAEPGRTEDLDDAVVIGLRFDINLAGIFNL